VATTYSGKFMHCDAVIGLNTYDEYGKPAPANIGRFQYTGQAWLPELGLYYYKHRMYHPTLGRFLQPDPIGYGDGLNLYNYVGSDPVNFSDPSGLTVTNPPIVITGSRCPSGWSCYSNIGSIYDTLGRTNPGTGDQEIVVTGRRPRSPNPKPAQQQSPNVGTGQIKERDCSEFQRAAEDISNLTGESASLATDISLGSGALATLTRSPFFGGLTGLSLEAAGLLGSASFLSDLMAGNTAKAAASKFVERTIDRALGRVLPSNIRGKLSDKISSGIPSSQCRR
jgi:RHS repeat-associated protein